MILNRGQSYQHCETLGNKHVQLLGPANERYTAAN